MNKNSPSPSSPTPVILVLVTNKQGKVLEHSQFFRTFSVFGQVKKILIFERKIIWKVFIEYETAQQAQQALILDGTLFDYQLKMRVHLSQRDSLVFQNNNNCGVDYTTLQSKQQFFQQLKEDSNSLNQQLQQNLDILNQCITQLNQTTDLKEQISLIQQIQEYRNQTQQLTVLYQQQLRNYASVLQREGKKQKQIISSTTTPSPSPFQHSTVDSIRQQILEESSEDDKEEFSDGESISSEQSPKSQKSVHSDDNYNEVFCNESSNPFSCGASPFTPHPQTQSSPFLMTPTPLPTYLVVQHPNTNLRVVYNIFSTVTRVDAIYQSHYGAFLQLASKEEANRVKNLLNKGLLLGMPMTLMISEKLPQDARQVALPPNERKAIITQQLSNAIQITGLTGVTIEQMYQYFGCMTPIQNMKFINQSSCKILYSDVGCSLSVLGHFQDAKINGRSVQLSFTAF
ncbi:unnamed protein product (macronuclear) [Paramecium tetraurelia]|uniref:RRM domain-containing protein n=1 Tax=Paramecium tetraurelia TaxID=5888 RepID=A0BRP8_PARTE|nr:uncharacterized protein GSPATT00031446001 [Paramecium tetraurelia]CAK61215.1 unnamed protein product [Paramecium tetraurelia]|eukprot:XP_001428613.1 hypothetical protein (macronuclear) [Paramecium tetraurelia strain d4-2]